MGCAPHSAETKWKENPGTVEAPVAVHTQTLDLLDASRNRAVPVVLYSGRFLQKDAKTKQKLAVLNHGYGGKNTAYSFIANYLVSQGYLVASIQHELPSDAPMPLSGPVYETRLPHWQRGVQSIRFVVQELERRAPDLNKGELLLVGHSNGGDMAMLFAQEYPEQVREVISLDNRRVRLPRTRQPRILTLRSSDQPADAGVLPTAVEQEKFGIRVIQLENTLHNDLWDGATANQKQQIIQYIAQFLRTN
ncbi:serine aminopeptidase domain-containing protein [Rufibacter roseolus]|uniref:serine aminopeptidase domain-containing protein n=1 Tax=Rufibacter roseolus TaxID=2817375 RepID=UPI001B311285|nr:alpha/beta hydrolase [Rufibacter roseolus]